VIAFKGGRISAGGKRTGLGTGFGGLIAYLQKGSKEEPALDRVAWSSGRNLDGIEDPRLVGHLMRAYAEENPRVERPVYHFGLSLSPGEHLTEEQWNAVADRVLVRMGLSDHQALLLSHRDTDREHVHIVVNRVPLDGGTAWELRGDMVKAYDEVHAIELDYGLRRTGGAEAAAPDLSNGAHQEALRTGEKPLADRVREAAGQDLAEASSWRDLDARLAARGFRLENAERGSGVVVSDGVRRASLSHIDRNLSGPRLAERFGESFREYRTREPRSPEPSDASGFRAVPGAEPAGPARRPPVPPAAEPPLALRAQVLIETLSSTRATFTEADVSRAALHEPDRETLVREAFKPGLLLEVGRDRFGAAPRYTTRAYLEAETRLFTSAERLAGRSGLRLETAGVDRIIEGSGARLSDEQKEAVLQATTRSDLSQIVGRAGAGKTTVARTIAEAYQAQGYEIRGAALAGKAAEGLQKEAGIPSHTLASLERAWKKGHDALDHRTVLVVDEAGMVDTRQLGRVLQEADRRGAKVVLLGDPDQLKPIGAGDAYRGLLSRYESAELETIRRQAEPWQREASRDLASGRVPEALDRYDQAGRLHWSENAKAARAALAARFLEDRRADPERSQLIVAFRNEDVRKLNEAVREGRRAAGELGPGTTLGRSDYAPGDRLVFLRNDNQGREVVNVEPKAAGLGIKNGTLGTVEAAAPERFVVRLDDGRRVSFDPRRYEAVAHGYAVTIHKSQGATVDRVYALASPSQNRQATYVALTRHREDVHLYADRQAFQNRPKLDAVLSREGRKDLVQDYTAADLGRLAARTEVGQRTVQTLRRQEQALKADLVTLDRAEAASRHVERTRIALHQAARRVYAHPEEAVAKILADPKSFDRLAAGEAKAYGPLRGQGRLLGRGIERRTAEKEIPGLRSVLWTHREALGTSDRQNHAVSQVAGGAAEIRGQLTQVTAALRQAATLVRSPEQALENAVRQASRAAVQTAVSLLPTPLQIPVRLALRVAELALGIGRELGR
jgi:hypothetical protein